MNIKKVSSTLFLSLISTTSFANYSIRIPIEVNNHGYLEDNSITFSKKNNPQEEIKQDPNCEYEYNESNVFTGKYIRVIYTNDVITRIELTYGPDSLRTAFNKAAAINIFNNGYTKGSSIYKTDKYIVNVSTTMSQDMTLKTVTESRPICKVSI